MKTQDDRIVRLDVALSRNTGDRLTPGGHDPLGRFGTPAELAKVSPPSGRLDTSRFFPINLFLAFLVNLIHERNQRLASAGPNWYALC